MLVELVVRDLGVIEELTLFLDQGMTAVTGETGAGKTLLVTAIDLLMGGRAESTMVRAGQAEAVVEGRFIVGTEEFVVRRVVPAGGRSRAYVNGELATAATLSDQGATLCDLHGQHAHQSLLSGPAQRGALDRFAGVDLTELTDLRASMRELDKELAALGGDERERARELDLVRYQVQELAQAGIQEGEDDQLAAEEALLADAVAHRAASASAVDLLDDDEGARALAARAQFDLEDRSPFESIYDRLTGLVAELDEVARDLRDAGQAIADDPARLAEIRDRLDLLGEMRRKYGDTAAEILQFAAAASRRLSDLENREQRADELDQRRVALLAAMRAEADSVLAARQTAAPGLADAATRHLDSLALVGARVEIEVEDDPPGDQVRFLFAAEPAGAALGLRKVASGGELARLMLALRLVLTAGPDTLVFDEVDAGIGGSAALAVGESLASLGGSHQVLVVTHLPQVAAFADAQVAIDKQVVDGRARTTARSVVGDDRVVELSRMLAGSPDSARAREHATELLAGAAAQRGR